MKNIKAQKRLKDSVEPDMKLRKMLSKPLIKSKMISSIKNKVK